MTIISAGIVPVRRVGGEYLFLLFRSGNFWDFPKGRVEAQDDSDLAAALREAEEEATLTPVDLDFKWGRESYTTESFNGAHGRKIGRYFLAETTKEDIELPVNPELGKPEHDGFKWVTYQEGQQLTNRRIGGVLKWAYNKITSKKQE